MRAQQLQLFPSYTNPSDLDWKALSPCCANFFRRLSLFPNVRVESAALPTSSWT